MYFNGNSKIIGVGSFLPDQKVNSESLLTELQSEKKFDISHRWIDEKVGIHERRYAPDDAKSSDLAIISAEIALDDANIRPEQLNAIIYCGIVGDQIEPSTAHNIQAKIGAINAICRDIKNACHGFCDGLHDADMMIAGGADYVLVVTAELTRVSRHALPFLASAKSADEFLSAIGMLTVGDGAGAMVVSRKESISGFQGMNLHSNGNHANLCQYDIVNGKFQGGMVMDKISGLMIRLNNKLKPETLNKLNWRSSDIDHLIMHQVGERPFNGMLKLLKVDKSRANKTLDRFGNLTTATIPVNYSILKSAHKLKKADRCLFVGGGSGLIISQSGYIV